MDLPPASSSLSPHAPPLRSDVCDLHDDRAPGDDLHDDVRVDHHDGPAPDHDHYAFDSSDDRASDLHSHVRVDRHHHVAPERYHVDSDFRHDGTPVADLR